MKRKKTWIISAVCLAFISYGCSTSEFRSQEKDEAVDREVKGEENSLGTSAKENDYEQDNYVSVQDYIGEGYELREANKEIEETAKAAGEQVEKAVIDYMRKMYKTEVLVTNIVGAQDAATVFVKSETDPSFYTYAIVPYDFDTGKMLTADIRTDEGQVENAIHGWLYAKAYPEEFEKLDQFLNEFTETYPVTGLTKQAVQNVGGNGFSNQYYLVNPLGLIFEEVYNMYLENPEIEGEEIRKTLENAGFVAEDIAFGISLYMDEEGAEPDQSIMDGLKTSLTNLEGIPTGTYALHLNDNYIDKRRASGSKTNTLKNIGPNEIIKE